MDTIKAEDLRPGDNIVTLDGQVHPVRNVSRGWYTNSVLIHWSGGWSCVGKDTILESPKRRQPQEASA